MGRLVTLCGVLAFLAAAPVGAEEAKETEPDPNRLEPGFLPAINFDSNLGFGFGAIANLARFAPEAEPYRWRIQAQAFASAKGAPGGGVEIPFQQHYVIADIPKFVVPWLRMMFTGRFERQINAGYYGLGNASRQQHPEDAFDPDSDAFAAAARFHQYDRIYPTARADARIELVGDFDLFSGLGFVWNDFNIYDGSKLQADLANPSLSGDLFGGEKHGQLELSLGVLYDTRNDEFAPSGGMFHEVSFRGGKLIGLAPAYGGVNATFRIFHALAGEHLVVASRVMLDILLGDAPFYELSRHGGFFPHDALAGSRGIRSLPGMRYHGRVKLLGNLELRSKLVSFSMFGLPSNFGVLAFTDTGRVWTELGARPELDGRDLRLKYAVGGGLRLQWGKTFIIRADTGWSPEGLGIFINVNHIF